MSAGVSVAVTVVHFVEAVKLLGVSRVMLDSALTFNQQVLYTFVQENYQRVIYCVILTIVSERVNKNERNFCILCTIW